jgi:glycosyltransferase involved in cell wall biosynthesis
MALGNEQDVYLQRSCEDICSTMTTERVACLVGPSPMMKGGVVTAMKHLAYIYKLLGFRVIWFWDLRSFIRHNKMCSIIHSNGLNLLIDFILLFNKKSCKILTLHGWIVDEIKLFLLSDEVAIWRRIRGFIATILNWLFVRFLLSVNIFKVVTAVSRITAMKNRVNAVVIPNAYICRRFSQKMNISSKKIFKVITYVSIGGGKFASLPVLYTVFVKLRSMLRTMGYDAVLEIYGKDVPSWLILKNDAVRYMGYVGDFRRRIIDADIFIAPYTFPELGYAVLDAMCAGVPVAKFTSCVECEEIKDGFNGIVSDNLDDFVKKIFNYLISTGDVKSRLIINAYRDILWRRDVRNMARLWSLVLSGCLV